MRYHPNFFEPNNNVKRADCMRRLNLIKKYASGGSLLDIGCSEGFYSFGLYSICNPILAIDYSDELINICKDIQDKYNTNINFIVQDFNHDFINTLGVWETILYMSVHHHIIAKYGFEVATDMLNKLSTKGCRMFFDMGQKNENCSEHLWWRLLPHTSDQKGWLINYLKNNTEFDNINIIGSSKVHGVDRYFFLLERDKIGDYFVFKKLYRTKGSKNQRFVETIDSNIENRRAFYIVVKNNVKYWVKEYVDLSLGDIDIEERNLLKYTKEFITDYGKVRAVELIERIENKLIFKYYEDYVRYSNVMNDLSNDVRNKIKQLIVKWLKYYNIEYYDLMPNNILLKFDKDLINIVLLDFEKADCLIYERLVKI